MIEEWHFIYRLIKLQIQSITETPVEVLRAGLRKDVKLMSIIPGKLKGQPHQLSFKFIRSANRLPMHPSSTLRPVVEHRGVEPLTSTMRMSRATNCANAPYMVPGSTGEDSSTFKSGGLGLRRLSTASDSITQEKRKGKTVSGSFSYFFVRGNGFPLIRSVSRKSRRPAPLSRPP